MRNIIIIIAAVVVAALLGWFGNDYVEQPKADPITKESIENFRESGIQAINSLSDLVVEQVDENAVLHARLDAQKALNKEQIAAQADPAKVVADAKTNTDHKGDTSHTEDDVAAQ